MNSLIDCSFHVHFFSMSGERTELQCHTVQQRDKEQDIDLQTNTHTRNSKWPRQNKSAASGYSIDLLTIDSDLLPHY
jgi:hypothetical protein